MGPVQSEISVAIITAPRKVVTIDRSLETYFAQHLPFPHVFAEPGADTFLYKSQVVLHPNGVRRGCFENWWYAAKWMIENNKTPYILMCEDDISWCRDGGKLLLDFANRDRVLTAWTPLVNATLGVTGWHPTAKLDMYGLCGSLALLFPREVLGDVLYARNMTKVNNVHLDTEIGWAIQGLKVPIFSYHPSLVTHLGMYRSTFDLSLIGEETVRARTCYASCKTSGGKQLPL